MDHTDGGTSSPTGVNSHRDYGFSHKSQPPQDSYTKPGESGESNHSNQEEDDEELGEEVEENEDTDVNGGVLVVGNGDHDKEGHNDNGDGDDFDDDDDEEEEEETGDGSSDGDGRYRKKQKLKSILSHYELVPRLPPPAGNNLAGSLTKPTATGGRNPLTDWTEHETAVLLDAWGESFLRHGRKSLRSEEWHEVAERVSQQSRVERTDSQCRNRLDTLKKKYKKEKLKLGETRGGSNWVFFRKMDMLMSSPSQQPGLSCGMDSGEYVFMNPKVYLNHANGLDEMRDSPGNSGSSSQEGDGGGGSGDEFPPIKRSGVKRRKMRSGGGSFQLVADSVQKFNAIYEEIENKKRQQMIELEKMRMDFHREIEMQRRQILERAQAEIVKIRQGCHDDDDENDDVSDENVSG